MAIPSTSKDDQQIQTKNSESSFSFLNHEPSIPPPASKRKKSFDSMKGENVLMKQVPKQEPAADIQNVKEQNPVTMKGKPAKKQHLPEDASIETASIKSDPPEQENSASRRQESAYSAMREQTERDVFEQRKANGKSQTTKKHDQASPVATHFGNSREKLHVTGFDPLSEAISRFEPDQSVQESPPIHQHIQQAASAIHQLDRQEIKVHNQEQNCLKETDSSTVSAKIGRVAEMFAQDTNQYAKLIKQGQPNVYLLNAKEISVGEDFRWFDIDHHDASATPEVHREFRDHKVVRRFLGTRKGALTSKNGSNI
jgi:hypothetical protein